MEEFLSSSSMKRLQWATLLIIEDPGFVGVQPHPVEPQKVVFLGAGLKRGGYRSAGSVLSQYRVDSIRAGFVLDQRIAQAFTDATRSCKRGVPALRLRSSSEHLELLWSTRAF